MLVRGSCNVSTFTMKTLAPLLLVGFLALSQAAPTNDAWELFKNQYNKKYESFAEEAMRRMIFMENIEKIEKHNAKYDSGEVTFSYGVNQFTDQLQAEIVALSGIKIPANYSSSANA